MTATAAQTGYGATLGIGNGATPPVYTVVAEVTALKGLKQSRDQIEATHLLSPGGYKEFIGGMKDFAALTAAINYVPGGAAETALLAAFGTQANKPYQITFPGGGTWSFSGVMTEYAPGDLDPNKKMEASVTIKPSGGPAIA